MTYLTLIVCDLYKTKLSVEVPFLYVADLTGLEVNLDQNKNK